VERMAKLVRDEQKQWAKRTGVAPDHAS
jgi:hypothetical protein